MSNLSIQQSAIQALLKSAIRKYSPYPNSNKPVTWLDLQNLVQYIENISGDVTNIYNTIITILNSPSNAPWYSEYQERYTTGSTLTTLYQDTLVADSLITDGSYFTFRYMITPANNSNAKTAYVKFQNKHVIDVSIPVSTSAPVMIEGTVKLVNKKQNIASYKAVAICPTYTNTSYGKLTSIDFTANTKLILQGQGVANSDITANEGEGVVYQTSPF